MGVPESEQGPTEGQVEVVHQELKRALSASSSKSLLALVEYSGSEIEDDWNFDGDLFFFVQQSRVWRSLDGDLAASFTDFDWINFHPVRKYHHIFSCVGDSFVLTNKENLTSAACGAFPLKTLLVLDEEATFRPKLSFGHGANLLFTYLQQLQIGCQCVNRVMHFCSFEPYV